MNEGIIEKDEEMKIKTSRRMESPTRLIFDFSKQRVYFRITSNWPNVLIMKVTDKVEVLPEGLNQQVSIP